MPPIVVLQQVKAPVEVVFNFVGNVETHPQIAPFCKEVKITSPEGHRGKGTRFHQIFHDRPECDSEIMFWEPSRKIVWHNFVGVGQGELQAIYNTYRGEKPAQIITYRFEQEGEFTHVLHTVDNEVYEDQTLHRGGTEENIRELASLKRLLEEA